MCTKYSKRPSTQLSDLVTHMEAPLIATLSLTPILRAFKERGITLKAHCLFAFLRHPFSVKNRSKPI